MTTPDRPTKGMWARRPRPNVAPRVETDREKYKRELAARTKRESLDALK